MEARRIHGKPRAVPSLPLGTAEAVLERRRSAPAGPLTVRSFQHGAVAALKAVADRLGVVKRIDRHLRLSLMRASAAVNRPFTGAGEAFRRASQTFTSCSSVA